jgi:hypothetical protein
MTNNTPPIFLFPTNINANLSLLKEKTMYRFFLAIPLFFLLSFSWSCGVCKTEKECRESDGYGITEIVLTVSSYDLKLNEPSSLRILFTAHGKTLECPASQATAIKNCTGTMGNQQIGSFRKPYGDEQRIVIEAKFAYKKLNLLIEHHGVILFNDIIDFEKEPSGWGWSLSPDCRYCNHRGTAYLTSDVTD